MEFYFISGHYMGEDLYEDHCLNFADGFNEIILKCLITKKTNTHITFTVTKIINLKLKNYECFGSIVLGDILEFDYVPYVYNKKTYYLMGNTTFNKIDLSTDISLLCEENLYDDMLIKNKYEELTKQLSMIEVDSLKEKEFLTNLLNKYINIIGKE